MRKLHTYECDVIAVDFDLSRCIHSEECIRGLRSVFDPGRRPWIDPSAAPADRVAEVIERCPTGALHYRRKDGGNGEEPDGENIARVGPDGPVYVRGDIRLELPGGETMEETRVALCRCGASKDKPFCDGSHEDAGFTDPGAIVGGRLVPAEEAGTSADGSVTLRGAENGPMLVKGPLRVEGADGSVSAGVKGALCRCGHSDTKPFCDGSHRDAEFEAD
jgi:CDGSH-type Zn-finger protein/uncharacterized Fe-S cluster protein YjdI